MKKENQEAVEEFLSRADSMSDDIIDDTRNMLGSLPFIVAVMRERPKYFALTSLADEMVCRPGHISPKTAELLALAAAAGAGAEHCMHVHIRAAVKEGASRDEILDTIMIAALVGKTRVLAPAFREFCSAFPDNREKGLDNQ